MGVHGLTTFLRDNRRALSKQETFSNTSDIGTRPLVIDGWSLIFALYNDSGLPWAYGGEYEKFAALVKNLATAWIAVGFEPYFVFDGPVPLSKTPTTLKRYTESGIQNANIFFRTSASARSTPSFLASTRILPPLLLETCLSVLRDLGSSSVKENESPSGPGVHILMADGEADPYCVSLAGKLGNGLVLGMDSDFAVLNVEGYGGYIPLDEMTWSSASDDTPPAQQEEDDGFTAVQTKQRAKRKQSGLIPPASTSELSLNVTIYHPQSLASYLNLPPALLPLFSALVGNDFSNPQNAKKFFEHRSNPIERIWKVARSVSAAIKKSNNGGKEGGDAVLDVIQTAVSHLLIRPDTIASGEMETIVDQTVEAALECTTPASSPSPSSSCAIHAEDECPLSSLSPELLNAYRKGNIHPRLINAITTGIVFPKLFLEDPEQKACGGACKTVWDWVWSVFTAGGHISFPTLGGSGSTIDGTESRGDDDSELISVIEDFTATEPSVSSESEDLASELRERLRGLALEESSSTPVPEAKSLVQYARRGLKLVPEPIQLPGLSELPSSGGAQDWTQKDRISVFLQGTRSHTPAILEAFDKDDIGVETLLWICALRCVVQSSPFLGGNATAPAVVGKWRKSEARAFISSLSSVPEPDSPLPLDTRTIQRTAQLLYAFDAGARLAEVLYLFGEEVGRAARMFSGRAVHSPSQGEVDEKLWELVCDVIGEDGWAHEPEKTKTKAKKKAKSAGAKLAGGGKNVGFNVLASLGTE
ncbi:hypothetical protein FRC11_004058 [Ceratobasidium sp. 423]|nr:hypothetical protein FRC11_004058 [Ceratobasidium sp. 423]